MNALEGQAEGVLGLERQAPAWPVQVDRDGFFGCLQRAAGVASRELCFTDASEEVGQLTLCEG
jgi:hypothetical protein